MKGPVILPRGLLVNKDYLVSGRRYGSRCTRSYATFAQGRPKMVMPKLNLPENATDEEKQLKMLKMQEKRSKPSYFSGASQPIPVIADLKVPTSLRDAWDAGGLKESWKTIKDNFTQWRTNAIHMYYLVGNGPCLPGMNPKASKYSPRIFRIRSVWPKAWPSGLRRSALEQYINYNSLFAAAEGREIYNIAHEPLSTVAAQRLAKRGGNRLVWQFHKEAKPTRVLAVRHAPGVAHGEIPERAAVNQVLVRFETYQGLAVYDRRGRLIKGSVADRNRVVDYFIFEHRGWEAQRGWVIKAQVYPPETVS